MLELNSKVWKKTIFGEIGLNVRTHEIPKVTRCPEELASSVGMLHQLQVFYGNFTAHLAKKSISVIRLSSNQGYKLM